MPGCRARPVRVGDDHDPGAGRAQPEDDAADPVRGGRDAALDPALRRRPGRRRRGGADDRRRGSRRPHRPELRLPGAEGDPQGRRLGAAVAHRPVRRHRHRRGARRRRAAGDGQDARRHRRRRTSPTARPGCGRRTPACGTSRCTAAPRREFYGGTADWDADRRPGRAARHPGARQRRHLGGRRRAAHGARDRLRRRGRRTRLPGPAVAVRRSRPRPSPAGPSAPVPTWPRSRGSCAGTPNCSPSGRASEQRGVTDFRKHVAWYLKGFAVGSELRPAMAQASSLAELDDLLARLDLDQPFPEAVIGQPRGRTSGARAVALPDGLARLARLARRPRRRRTGPQRRLTLGRAAGCCAACRPAAGPSSLREGGTVSLRGASCSGASYGPGFGRGSPPGKASRAIVRCTVPHCLRIGPVL